MFPTRPGSFSAQNSESPSIQGPPDRWFHINFSDKMVDCMKRETFDISKVRLLRSRGMLPVIYSTHHLPHVNNRKSNHYDDGECPHGPGYDKIIFFHAWPLVDLSRFETGINFGAKILEIQNVHLKLDWVYSLWGHIKNMFASVSRFMTCSQLIDF